MAQKPLYSKFLTSAEFSNKEDAQDWAEKQKKMYKSAEQSVKHDIARTPNSTWKVTLYAKV